MANRDIHADAVALVHVGFVAFVLIGFVIILSVRFFQRRWACNGWFRLAHLTAVLYSAIRTSLGWACPLTSLETWLRKASVSSDELNMGLIGWSHRLVFKGTQYHFVNTMPD